MRVLDIPTGFRRVGKLRLGETVDATKADGTPTTRPAKLDTWRVTSGDEIALRTVAEAYGGELKAWDNNGAAEFEVVTDAAVLDVMVIPGDDAFSSSYELWSAGGCQRRCDGQTEQLSGDACKCPADQEERTKQSKLLKPTACKLTTRLSVILPKVAALGVWQVESHGFYAAKELASTIDLLDLVGARRKLLPARLRIEQRRVVKDGKTNKFGVPVLDIGMTFDSLLSNVELAPAGVDPTTGEITTTPQAALPAAPEPEQPKAATSKKAAEARKTTTQMSAEVKGNDPVAPIVFTELKGRYDSLDPEHRGLCNAAGVTLKSRPKQSELSTITGVLAEVEVKQAEAWEDRRKAVFVGLGQAFPEGIGDDARHELLAKATKGLRATDGGQTGSTKYLTQAQTNAILDHLDGLAAAS